MRLRIERNRDRVCECCAALDVSLILVAGKTLRLCGLCLDRITRLRVQLYRDNLDAVEAKP